MPQLFFELLQIAIGTRSTLSSIPSAEQWEHIKHLSHKHALAGVIFYAIEKLVSQHPLYTPDADTITDLFLINQNLIHANRQAIADILNLTRIFHQEGFDTCLLKGQGLALLYPQGMQRMPGDIDLWAAPRGPLAPLRQRRHSIVALCHKVVGKQPVHYHHTPLPFKGRNIEVHFTPSWMFSPWHNHRLQRFFDHEWQHRRYVDATNMPVHDSTWAAKGFCVPSLEMDAVFLQVHIFRHLFSEGIGLRQIVDYYMLLQQEDLDRPKVLATLRAIGLLSFTGALMWTMRQVLQLPDNKMLCPPDDKLGQLLLDEIMHSGNMGSHDQRYAHINKKGWHYRVIVKMQRDIKFLFYFPSEVLFAPIWKIWQKIFVK